MVSGDLEKVLDVLVGLLDLGGHLVHALVGLIVLDRDSALHGVHLALQFVLLGGLEVGAVDELVQVVDALFEVFDKFLKIVDFLAVVFLPLYRGL